MSRPFRFSVHITRVIIFVVFSPPFPGFFLVFAPRIFERSRCVPFFPWCFLFFLDRFRRILPLLFFSENALLLWPRRLVPPRKSKSFVFLYCILPGSRYFILKVCRDPGDKSEVAVERCRQGCGKGNNKMKVPGSGCWWLQLHYSSTTEGPATMPILLPPHFRFVTYACRQRWRAS